MRTPWERVTFDLLQEKPQEP